MPIDKMECFYYRHDLQFYRPSGTSRGVLRSKETWILILKEDGKVGVGECGILRGLSRDDRPDYEEQLLWLKSNIDKKNASEIKMALQDFPSILFGFEQALKSLQAKDPFQLFSNDFSNSKDGIDINGLIWMGELSFMKQQVREKLEQGFHCIKLKIGALNFESEIDLIKGIRKEYAPEDIEIRVDANGAFNPEHALEKLKVLSDYHLHSIEQPIRAGQIEDMAALCLASPLAIALDEELIPKCEHPAKLLEQIQAQYIILKPSLVGGFERSAVWIEAAKQFSIGYWITSALESNIGLNAIAQWTYELGIEMPQGLGTGQLYSNNFESPLEIEKGRLYYRRDKKWDSSIVEIRS